MVVHLLNNCNIRHVYEQLAVIVACLQGGTIYWKYTDITINLVIYLDIALADFDIYQKTQ